MARVERAVARHLSDAGRDAAGRDPLEPSLDGAGERPRALDHSSPDRGFPSQPLLPMRPGQAERRRHKRHGAVGLAFPAATSHVQKSLNPLRCQPMTVSGLTITRAWRQPGHR